MYVLVFLSVWTSVCVHASVCMCGHLSVYTCKCVYVWTSVCVYVQVCVYVMLMIFILTIAVLFGMDTLVVGISCRFISLVVQSRYCLKDFDASSRNW